MPTGYKTSRCIKVQAGFSTLELLLAMTILTLSLATIILVLFGSQSLASDSQNSVEAVNKAQGMLENQQALARKDFNLVNATSTVDGMYQKAVTVTQKDLYTKEVTANITWMGEYGRPQTVSLSALVTNYQNVIGGNTCSSVLVGNWTSPQIASLNFGALVGDPAGAYSVSGIDVYEGKLYATVAASSQATAVTNPAMGADNASVGTLVWNNPGNITTSNDVRASLTLTGTAITHYLKASNFGFSIPNGATILGIKVDVERVRTGAGSTVGEVKDSQVKIVKADSSIGTLNKASGTSWPSTESTANYGGVADLWGETNWSPANINNANFGVVIAATGSTVATNRIANVDNIKITITYIKEFYIFDLTTPSNPVFTSGLGSNPGISTGFNAVAVDGKYAYVATNSGPAGAQLQVIDLAVNPPAVLRTYALPVDVTGAGSQALGKSIFYKNGYIFLGLTKTASGPEFNIIDASRLISGNPNPRVGSYAVGNTVNSILIKGNYAYLAVPNSSEELMVLDISNPINPIRVPASPVVSYNAPAGGVGSGYGERLYTVGDTLYFGRSVIAGSPEFYILNNSVPANLTANNASSATYEVGKTINGLIIRDSLAFLLTGSGSTGGNLRIVNIFQPLSITDVSTVTWPNSTGGVGGTSLDCEGNYIYAGSVDDGNIGYLTAVTGN